MFYESTSTAAAYLMAELGETGINMSVPLVSTSDPSSHLFPFILFLIKG